MTESAPATAAAETAATDAKADSKVRRQLAYALSALVSCCRQGATTDAADTIGFQVKLLDGSKHPCSFDRRGRISEVRAVPMCAPNKLGRICS
jgi:hypothetical protein